MTIFGHRNGSGGYRIYTGVSGGYRNPPGGYWASWAQLVEEERRPRGSHAPLPPQVRIGQGGGRRPPFLSPSLLPSPLLVQQGREGVLLPVGVGLLLARLLLAGRTSSLSPLYTGVGGTLETQQLILKIY